MKVPALRAEMGGRTYYVTTLTFEQVSQFVSPIDDQLHKSETLNDMIQRSITNNFLSIKEYVLNQPELFFNSLILAVYDDYPEWNEIEVRYDDETTYQMGLLNFPGNHKIFPVDGQHRVEGIKAALKEKPELGKQTIAAIFIGHKNDPDGKQATRRLFTTLNRYAKPVSLDDIIALDEDDIVAIITRYVLEDYDLFSGKRIVYAKQKGIPSNNKTALTSIITLYQANFELFKAFYIQYYQKKPTSKTFSDHLKFRRDKKEIEAFQYFTLSFWEAFKGELSFITTFLKSDEAANSDMRNNDNGGNLVFRPIGFLPLVKTALLINQRTQKPFVDIFARLNKLDFQLDHKPWLYVLWNPIERKMLTNPDILTQLLLLYLYDPYLLSKVETEKLKNAYAAKISSEEDIDTMLNALR